MVFMKKRKVQIQEYSSSILQGLSEETENTLFNTADRLSEFYKSQHQDKLQILQAIVYV